jgi:hypothetical protein
MYSKSCNCSWINGPQPASVHATRFLQEGKAGKRMNGIGMRYTFVGDSGYEVQPDKVTTTKDAHNGKWQYKNSFQKDDKSMLETCNGIDSKTSRSSMNLIIVAVVLTTNSRGSRLLLKHVLFL